MMDVGCEFAPYGCLCTIDVFDAFLRSLNIRKVWGKFGDGFTYML